MMGSLLAAAVGLAACDRSATPGSDASNSPSAAQKQAPAPAQSADNGNAATPQGQGAAPAQPATGNGMAPAPSSADKSADNSSTAPGMQPAQGKQASDAAIGAGVTTALQNDSQLKGQNISVSSQNGLVTLSGTVAQAAQRDRAAQVTLAVNGVTGVANRLTVNGG
jgi:hyperosmotically inducible protein